MNAAPSSLDPTGHQLPDRTTAVDAWSPRCPWCRDEITDLAVPIEALQAAWEAKTLTGTGNWLYRDRPFTGAEAECPRCGRGLLIKFVTDREAVRSDWRQTVLFAPLRSEADCRFIAEKMGLF